MAVPSTVFRNGPYTPNGVTTTFPFTFNAASTDEVRVYRDNGAGVITEITSGFTVELEDDHTGDVVFDTAPAGGAALYLESAPAFTQELEVTNQGPFLAETHEEAFDRSVQRDLWLKDRADRSLLFPPGTTIAELIGSGFIANGPSGPYIATGMLSVPASSFGASLVAAVSASAGRIALGADSVNDLWQQSRGPYGTGGINATPQLNALFTVSPNGRLGQVRVGQYRMDSSLVVGSVAYGAVNLIGEASGAGAGQVSNTNCTQFVPNYASGDVIYVGPTRFGPRLEHFQVNSNVGIRTSGSGVRIDCTGEPTPNFAHRINNLAFNAQFTCLSMVATGIGTIENLYCTNWVNIGLYMNGDGAHEAAGGSVTRSVFFGDGLAGTAQVCCVDLRNGYTQIRNSLVIGAQVGCYIRPDIFPAGAPEYINNWTEENDLVGLLVQGGTVPVSMLAANWNEFSIAGLGAAGRPNYQGSIIFAAGASPYLSCAQAIGNRFRNTAGNAAGASVGIYTGTRVQVALNNIEGLSGNLMKGIAVGAQAAQVSVLDNMVGGVNGAKYDLTNEVMLRDFCSRLTAAEVNAITAHDGSLVWVEDGMALSNPLIGGGAGCIAERRGGIWRALHSADAPTVAATDAAFTIAAGVAVFRHTGVLTADRLVTLPAGPREFRITRTGAGAFNLSIGGLKNLATNTWCVIRRDAGGLYLAEYGTL